LGQGMSRHILEAILLLRLLYDQVLRLHSSKYNSTLKIHIKRDFKQTIGYSSCRSAVTDEKECTRLHSSTLRPGRPLSTFISRRSRCVYMDPQPFRLSLHLSHC
jgi:hypothetical protein